MAVRMGYLQKPLALSEEESTDDESYEDDSETIADSDDKATSDDEDSEEDDGGEELADSFEIPEFLRPVDAPSPIVVTALGALVENLFPSFADTEKALSFDRAWVLSDGDKRISNDFQIPEGLKDRVGFWFDVYTKYDSNHRVIHHSLFPWIVYKVVDVSYIIESDTPKHEWMRRQKADRLVKQEALKIRANLHKLANRKSLKNLSDDEQALIDILSPLGGDARKQALKALRSVRVQTGQKDHFADGLAISSRYLGTMERIFERYRLPFELTRIPFVESSFNKRATSKVGASGIWQFMGNTGRKFMMVSGAIDERRSPFKASEAAARLLKENHLILYRSWPLAVTAWNHGPTGLRKAIQRAGSRDLSTIISRYRSRSFDFASSNFYSEFLAALHAERYSPEVFGQLEKEPHMELLVVKLARAVRFSELLKVSGMNADDFLSINPELSTAAKKNLMLPRGFRLHLPEAAIQSLQSLFAAAEKPSMARNRGS